jgi:hypothetical protein
MLPPETTLETQRTRYDRHLHLKVSESLERQIAEISTIEGKKISEVVRDAIRRHVECYGVRFQQEITGE